MIKYIKGNVVEQTFSEPTIIPHIVNNENKMGSGLAYALYKKWPEVKKQYHKWYLNRWIGEVPFQLGKVQFIEVNEMVTVANMVGQTECNGQQIYGVMLPPIRLDCLYECMLWVGEYCLNNDIHHIATGKFGSLRAGGDWDKDIVPMINEIWNCLKVTIYEYQEK